MSTQFAFWATEADLDPRGVYDALMEGEHVDGLAQVDSAAAERALIAAFPGWTVDGTLADHANQTALSAPDHEGALDAGHGPQSVVVTCYGMTTEQFNAVIEAMIGLGLPLYDPQIDERFA